MTASLKSAIPLHRTCRQASHLMLQEQDKPLSLWNRTALRLHLWICKTCPKFHGQLISMNQALSDWRNELQR